MKANPMTKEQITKRYKEIVNSKRVILLAKAGSEALGISEGNTGDTDLMGVYIEDPAELLGFSTREHIIWRSAEERTGKPDAKSEKGDIDLALYGLRKFVRTALTGNPNMLNLLFAPVGHCDIRTFHGEALQALAPKMVAKSASHAFLGYLNAQRLKFLGSRNAADSGAYDKKFAMHAYRLGKQGIDLILHGRLTIPMYNGADTCRYIRRGDYSFREIESLLQEVEEDLKEVIETTTLPPKPDYDAVEAWLLDVYANTWWGRS